MLQGFLPEFLAERAYMFADRLGQLKLPVKKAFVTKKPWAATNGWFAIGLTGALASSACQTGGRG
jgi:hypothetical protein